LCGNATSHAVVGGADEAAIRIGHREVEPLVVAATIEPNAHHPAVVRLARSPVGVRDGLPAVLPHPRRPVSEGRQSSEPGLPLNASAQYEIVGKSETRVAVLCYPIFFDMAARLFPCVVLPVPPASNPWVVEGTTAVVCLQVSPEARHGVRGDELRQVSVGQALETRVACRILSCRA
jgi:hypothetical protein